MNNTKEGFTIITCHDSAIEIDHVATRVEIATSFVDFAESQELDHEDAKDFFIVLPGHHKPLQYKVAVTFEEAHDKER